MSHQTKPFAWLPLLLIALAFALTLHALAADSFWGDEILTASFASRSPAEVIRWTASDIHPPLYYLIAGTFTKLMIPLGTTPDPGLVTDWLWRFPSVIAVVLTVAVTYRLASRFTIYDLRFTPPIAALLLALSPIAIKYGQEARMHALFMALSALATLLLFRALDRPRSWRRWLAFALVTTANIYTMYFGFLILAAHTALVGFTVLDLRFTLTPSSNPSTSLRTSRSIAQSPNLLLTRFILTTLLALLLYLPWWPVLFDILRRRAAVGAIEGGVGDPLMFVTGVVRALGPTPMPVAWLFLGLFIVGLIFLARRSWPLAAFGALWLILPAALPILLGDPRALQFRYAFILPLYLTLIAHAIVSLSIVVTTVAGHRPTQHTTPISPSPHLQSPNLSISQPPNLQSPISTPSPSLRTSLPTYLTWLLATLSFIATLTFYAQTKPNWRGAAAYLDERARPVDIILVGPLWDEGRFIDYYYRGQAQLLTPAAVVANIQGYAAGLRANGGRVWAVNRFAPTETAVLKNIDFSGVIISEPTVPVYEPALLTAAAIDLADQAVTGAYPWAEAAEAQGVLNPDPRTAQAAALRALGDTLVAAGRPQEALEPYQTAVDIFPGWVNGFLVLAETQESIGNLPAAAAAYRQAVAFNSAWHGPSADEAASLVEQGEWSAALEKYHQIVN